MAPSSYNTRSEQPRRAFLRWPVILLCALLAAHASMLYCEATWDSATLDEVGHLAAGLSHWRNHDFVLYRVNPPLVRLIACAPVAFTTNIAISPYNPNADPSVRFEFYCGRKLAAQLGPRYFTVLTRGRWATIPLSLIGCIVCYLWARDLWGEASGITASALWATSPTIIAYGHLITPDVGAAALGAAAAYAYWRWLSKPTWARCAAMGILLGVAETTKLTWMFLFMAWPSIWLAERARRRAHAAGVFWRRELLQLLTGMLLALWVMNLVYGFSGVLPQLGSFQFCSDLFRGPKLVDVGHGVLISSRNRFSDGPLAQIPIPLPRDYVQGIDYIRMEFEHKMWSYFDGHWRFGGWWYYYLAAMVLKEPLGSLMLGLLSLTLLILWPKKYSGKSAGELTLFVCAFGVIVLVSSNTGFNHHLRCIVPAYPFLFITVSRVARSLTAGHRLCAVIAAIFLGFSVVSGLSVYPQSMSYFNELAGGPKRGHYYLGASNADWGQDLLYLKDWYDRHPAARELGLGYDMALVDPRILGIEWHPLPAMRPANGEVDGPVPPGPQPGWFAVSVNWLHDREHEYDYFNELTPVDWVGYTLPIYHLTEAQANDLRRRHGMPLIVPNGQ